MKPSTRESAATPGANKTGAPRTPHFDKLRVMKTLQAATFSEDQAGAMVEAMDDAQRHLATKSDMEKMEYVLRTDLEKVESGIRTDMQKVESGIRTDMGKMELSLRGEIKDLHADMQAEFKRLYWYVPIVVGVMASIMGAFASL